ncbi:MAG: hypothetical protein HN871_07325, partial [Alphaproteobacteria bacterium]|nr:hypothetical protein [Alphaproteobacteria bacterium]
VRHPTIVPAAASSRHSGRFDGNSVVSSSLIYFYLITSLPYQLIANAMAYQLIASARALLGRISLF